MNTHTITAAVSSNSTGTDQARRRDGSTGDEGFSTVLGEQQSALSQSPSAVRHDAETAPEGKSNAELAENAAEQGLHAGVSPNDAAAVDGEVTDAAASTRTLPQIALQLAADIADIRRGVSAQAQDRSAAQTDTSGKADRSLVAGMTALAAAAGRRDAGVLAVAKQYAGQTADARQVEFSGRAAASASGKQAADATEIRGTVAPQGRLDTDAILGAHARQASANAVDNSPSTIALKSPLGPGKSASIAGAKQAVLAMQARMQAADAVQLPTWQSAGGTVFNFHDPLARAFADLPEYASMQTEPVQLEAQASLLAGGMGATSSHGAVSLNLAPAAQAAVSTPLNNPQWGADFSRQFVSLTQNGQTGNHVAELRLDPPDLGPLRISINISDNVAHALFISPHASVRQSVEGSLAQLQQALADAGISLGQANVSDEGQHAEQAFHESLRGGSVRGNAASTTGGHGAVEAASVPGARRAPVPDALVDTFA